MPGFLKGGNSKTDASGAPINVPINPVVPPWGKMMQDSLQLNMPGQLPELALDMRKGGFVPDNAAGHKSMLAYLNSIFKPAQTYKIGAPPVAPVKKPWPKVPVVQPGTGGGYVIGYNPDGSPIYGAYTGGHNTR